MTRRSAAFLYLALTACVVLFHLSLILGAPFGVATMGGRWPGVLPTEGRLSSALSGLLLLLMARIVAEAGGIAPRRLPGASIWPVALVLLAALVMNTITPSWVERAIWVPVVLVQGACVGRLLRG